MQASLAGSSSRSAANGPGVRRCACALRGPARPSQRCIARREPCCRLGAAVAAAASAEPTISVTFQDSEGAKAEVDCPSGEQLRAVMMENKVGGRRPRATCAAAHCSWVLRGAARRDPPLAGRTAAGVQLLLPKFMRQQASHV